MTDPTTNLVPSQALIPGLTSSTAPTVPLGSTSTSTNPHGFIPIGNREQSVRTVSATAQPVLANIPTSSSQNRVAQASQNASLVHSSTAQKTEKVASWTIGQWFDNLSFVKSWREDNVVKMLDAKINHPDSLTAEERATLVTFFTKYGSTPLIDYTLNNMLLSNAADQVILATDIIYTLDQINNQLRPEAALGSNVRVHHALSQLNGIAMTEKSRPALQVLLLKIDSLPSQEPNSPSRLSTYPKLMQHREQMVLNLLKNKSSFSELTASEKNLFKRYFEILQTDFGINTELQKMMYDPKTASIAAEIIAIMPNPPSELTEALQEYRDAVTHRERESKVLQILDARIKSQAFTPFTLEEKAVLRTYFRENVSHDEVMKQLNGLPKEFVASFLLYIDTELSEKILADYPDLMALFISAKAEQSIETNVLRILRMGAIRPTMPISKDLDVLAAFFASNASVSRVLGELERLLPKLYPEVLVGLLRVLIPHQIQKENQIESSFRNATLTTKVFNQLQNTLLTPLFEEGLKGILSKDTSFLIGVDLHKYNRYMNPQLKGAQSEDFSSDQAKFDEVTKKLNNLTIEILEKTLEIVKSNNFPQQIKDAVSIFLAALDSKFPGKGDKLVASPLILGFLNPLIQKKGEEMDKKNLSLLLASRIQAMANSYVKTKTDLMNPTLMSQIAEALTPSNLPVLRSEELP